MNFSFITNKKIPTIIAFVVCAGAFIYFLFNVWNVIINTLPIEFREGHSMSSTFLMLKGLKPFDVSSYPQYYNSYGIVYNFLMLPFVLVFGKSLVVFRIVNELFWMFTVIIVAFYKSKSFNSWKAVVIVAMYILLHYNTNLSIRPDGLGTFLFVASLVIAYRNNFSDKSVLVAFLLSLVAFYTKPYFILSWYILSCAFLIKNWKKCIFYNVAFHISLIASAWIIIKIFPLYFYETIFAYLGEINEYTTSDISGLYYSWLQLKWTIKDSLPLILLCAPVLCILHNKSLWPILVYVLVSVVFLIPLGTNFGATQTYHSQLFIPLLSLLALEIMPFVNNKEFYSLIASLLLLVTIHRMPLYRCDNLSEWNRITNYTNNSKKILNSPIIAPLLLLDDKDVVDDGVSVFVFFFNSTKVTSVLFGQDSLLLDRKREYVNNINERIKDRYYDCIIITQGYSVISDVDTSFYKKVDSFDISLPTNPPFNIDIYLPKDDSIANYLLKYSDFNDIRECASK